MVSKKREESKKVIKSEVSKKRNLETNELLLNNFIALQKVMVNLAVKIDSLSNQISKLLELFEISAKSLAKKDLEQESKNKESQKILEKLDVISQQAGLIGKGLALIHEMNYEEKSEQSPQKNFSTSKKIGSDGTEDYQKSVAHNFSRFDESADAGTFKSEENIFSRKIGKRM